MSLHARISTLATKAKLEWLEVGSFYYYFSSQDARSDENVLIEWLKRTPPEERYLKLRLTNPSGRSMFDYIINNNENTKEYDHPRTSLAFAVPEEPIFFKPALRAEKFKLAVEGLTPKQCRTLIKKSGIYNVLQEEQIRPYAKKALGYDDAQLDNFVNKLRKDYLGLPGLLRATIRIRIPGL